VPPLPERLELRFPARTSALADARHLLRRWLRFRGAGDAEAYDVVVACQEACTNAIEHAYGPGGAEVRLEAFIDDEHRVHVTVRDTGQWRAPRGTGRGRGLPMMNALMDEVDVRREAEGTEVRLVRRLNGDR
jgi:anti-sigma regulatory factor (Ser/Thr protein kinase)